MLGKYLYSAIIIVFYNIIGTTVLRNFNARIHFVYLRELTKSISDNQLYKSFIKQLYTFIGNSIHSLK